MEERGEIAVKNWSPRISVVGNWSPTKKDMGHKIRMAKAIGCMTLVSHIGRKEARS